jgi:CheY-specific phosphatase CheX
MSAEPSRGLLARTLGGALEEAAFVFAEDTGEPPPFDNRVMEARLSFAGPEDGELVLAVAPRFASMVAANLLGEDEGGAEATGDDSDAVGELLNMIAGTFVVELFGEAPCRLGLPRVSQVVGEDHERTVAAAHAASTMVDEDGNRIDLSLSLGGRQG